MARLKRINYKTTKFSSKSIEIDEYYCNHIDYVSNNHGKVDIPFKNRFAPTIDILANSSIKVYY